MKKSILSIMLAAATLAAAVPMAAQARDNGRHRGWDHHDRSYRDNGHRGRYNDRRSYNDRRYANRSNCRSGGTTGLILGGAAGALLGRAVDTRGERTTGTVLGAGAGALLGREVDRGSRC